MRALMYDRYGGSSELVLRDVPNPEAGADELLVKVAAAAVNPIDWKIMQGDLRLMTGWRFPRHVGADFAGTVAAVGAAVNGLRIGDVVFGAINTIKGDRGSMAEFARVKAGECALKPAGASFIEAAALGAVGAAALTSVDTLGKVRAGQRLLVIGASGGLGSTVVQIAKARGLHVTGVCSARNGEFVRALGADEVVAYDREDIFAQDGRFDVIVDAVGLHPFSRCAPLLTARGVYVNCIPGPRVLFQVFMDALRARLTSRQRARWLFQTVNTSHLRELASLVERGQLHAAVGHTFPLAEARQAIELSMTHRARGKIVITVAA
jgi:NADPH:quinone reductase-like Zn-dependent oxidoreductase